ncbi:helix-turn-helix domain-containing protein [Sinisalibacter aestuarii]|uniref:HTH araC/xylS-type domain-containing protein n=1 Tax=Sinisalibacter aestuarii TaxID=2949426 RepID=A0ABQ5LY25_9RHOB|nr:helix-turn-helix domain-containing protein [Sinisalibacter aestuarii]GKY89844.1 hypothetical protein STA1M1_37130 [Sinisalibacter aestuarii]
MIIAVINVAAINAPNEGRRSSGSTRCASERDPMLVSSIAYACGFNDVSYFNRQFRRLFGCAPGQFAEAA